MSKDLVIVVVDFPTLDLFAGAGGLSQGMASAGLTVVGASEMDNDALETYKSSHLSRLPQSSLELFEGDVGRHSFRSLKGEIAVVAGGPPCQPYSLGGLRRGVADDRDGIPQFVRVVSEVMPEAFLMENVPGLARGTQLPVLKRAIEKFRELGFLVTWKILHAADFGVSQRRQRLFVVGTRKSNFKWPKPTHGADTSRAWVAAREVLDASRPIGDLNNAIITYAKSPDLRPSPWDGHLWNGGGRPINPDGLVPTLLASMGGNKTPWLDGGNIVPDYHAYLLAGGAPRRGIVAGARRLTYQEAAMVQGFSLDMSWCGGRSSIYRQIGNAVPVPLAKAVGSALVKAMARTEDSIKPRGLAVL
ncbi:DNA cytosine methyltransferase [Dietzia aurantiaca]|uniref:DNA cytosine methyltransferase n=1 Tax=Dietzia aurantiaca TaxID=983873 RepID=UPI001E52B000|nr:DNA cytosine methyltransferase [Dietzia aurantiaca]MCD2263963.1 DNA cytosine methyltransferase [Dietzia aurantiaca]